MQYLSKLIHLYKIESIQNKKGIIIQPFQIFFLHFLIFEGCIFLIYFIDPHGVINT